MFFIHLLTCLEARKAVVAKKGLPTKRQAPKTLQDSKKKVPVRNMRRTSTIKATLKDAEPILKKAKQAGTARSSSASSSRKRSEAAKKTQKAMQTGDKKDLKQVAKASKRIIKRTHTVKQVIKEGKKITKNLKPRRR